MPEQLSLTVPTQNGEQPAESVQARLLHRRDDPVTSKWAARKVADRLTTEQKYVFTLIAVYGPGTAMEIAQRSAASDLAFAHDPVHVDSVDARYHRIMRRTGELKRALAVETTGEERDGRQVLRVKERA